MPYTAAVNDSSEQVLTFDQPLTLMRVRHPRWRLSAPWRFGFEHDDPAAMTDWLEAEAVHPRLGEDTGTYGSFLEDLTYAQSLLAGVANRRGVDHVPPDAVPALRSVVSSPHRISLPAKTLAAAEAFLVLATARRPEL